MKEEILEAVKAVFLPELEKFGERLSGIEGILGEMSARLTDINQHIIRLDKRIDGTNSRIDETNARIDETNARIDETNSRIDELERSMIARIDKLNTRIDRLYEVIVRREEHERLSIEVEALRKDVEELKRKRAV
ncbi:MAG: hypothetical protein D6679_00125 [Candidatus Hydrogenedentota bacterium]|nr:MAG: hypothetical protein D6679_00125 [Candidatus Hydrogenedentota bacterium]